MAAAYGFFFVFNSQRSSLICPKWCLCSAMLRFALDFHTSSLYRAWPTRVFKNVSTLCALVKTFSADICWSWTLMLEILVFIACRQLAKVKRYFSFLNMHLLRWFYVDRLENKTNETRKQGQSAPCWNFYRLLHGGVFAAFCLLFFAAMLHNAFNSAILRSISVSTRRRRGKKVDSIFQIILRPRVAARLQGQLWKRRQISRGHPNRLCRDGFGFRRY